MVESYYWIWLQQIFGIGTARSDSVISAFNSPKDIFDMKREELISTKLFTKGEVEKILATPLEKAKKAEETAYKLGAKIITLDCDDYPLRLKNTYSPPLTLYVLGEMPDVDNNLSIAIVGTRKCTDYGFAVAKKLSLELSEASTVIVSGLAVGIDAISHNACIDNGGKTIAVIGSGIDNEYPLANASLRRRIINGGGAVITEFTPGIAPNAFNFPMRNRIISGLSAGIVVVEAAKRSGTLITAGHALSQNRDVFAVPGSIFNPMSEGANILIKQGAKPIACGADILEEYSMYNNYILKPTEKEMENTYNFCENEQLSLIKPQKIANDKTKNVPPPYLNPLQIKVFEAIAFENTEKSADEIAAITDLPINKILSSLTELEIFGAIKSETGRKFRIN